MQSIIVQTCVVGAITTVVHGACLVPENQTVIFTDSAAANLISSVCYSPPQYGALWTPTREDLTGVEDGLVAFLDSQKVSKKRDWSSFRRQVAGIVRGKQRYLFISYCYFSSEIEKEMARRKDQGFDPDYWKKHPIVVCDGGDLFFRVLYDVRTRTFIWYECNGEA